MKKQERIKRYGKAAYEKMLQQKRDKYTQYRKELYIEKEKWQKDNPNEVKTNPKRISAIRKQWRDEHPLYFRDYKRGRIMVTDPLIFQFMDNGFDNNVDEFVIYLRSQNVSEQHISWFKKDVQKFIGEVEI